VAVFTEATEPGRVLLSLSIQKEAIGKSGIIRDDGPPYVIRKARGGARRVEDAARQRAGFLPAIGARDSHLRRFERARPDRIAVAVAGCGNLQVNPGVEARALGTRAGIGGFMRAGIRVAPDGRGALIRLSRLATALAGDRETRAPSPDGFVITGPLLVADGRAENPDVREYADLRHLILPAYVEIGPGRRVDFGFDALVGDEALARDAVAGRPVTLRLSALAPASDRVDADLVEVPVAAEAVRSALRTKGYRESRRGAARGTFRMAADHVEIAFLEGIYPHHALAVDAAGVVTSVLVTGRSNREGTTVRALAAALAKAGAVSAVLLDNGGDVGLLRRAGKRMVFAARPAEADRARVWPLRSCLVYHQARSR
jgi:Phosphodiester glycosidase